MKLFILMSDTGGGHRSAAEAVTAALGELDADLTAELLDFFATCALFPLNQAGRIYGPWVNHAASLWGAGFHLTNGRRRATLLGAMISLGARQCVEARLRAFQPDVMVCVHPLATRLATDVRRRVRRDLPSITIVTDLVTAHAAWFTRDVDLLIAPSEAVKSQAMEAGIPANRIAVTGQPVHPRFTEISVDQSAAREALALAPDRFTVLLIGGGEGMGRVASMARAVSEAGLPLQQRVVCGRNERLRRQLEKQIWGVPTRIFGFVRDMPILMHAADVVATKAGPSTICEALVVGRPILLTGYVPGQERGNVDFVVQAGAGHLTETPEALVCALRQLLDSGGTTRQQMTANARRLARPSAARDIAHLIREFGVRAGRSG
ncbi:MAG: galactosyldiacylglycerol synthase [Chloroflexi bacterium]|nr:MAG: galactosyldiacylglycerol synthase [Chloroflexota bacterium]